MATVGTSACAGPAPAPSTAPTPSPRTSADTPKPTGTDTNSAAPAAKAKDFELRAGQNPAQVGANVTGIVDAWGMEGATPGLGSTDVVLRTPLKTVAQNMAAQNTPDMATKLFGPNYQQKMETSPRIKTFVSNMQADNAANIEAFVHTDNTGLSTTEANPNNLEAWKQTVTFESVKSSTPNSDGTTTDVYAVKEADNSYMNIYAASNTHPSTQEDLLTVTYKAEGPALDITDISLAPAQQQ